MRETAAPLGADTGKGELKLNVVFEGLKKSGVSG